MPSTVAQHVGEISTFVRLDSLRTGVGHALTEVTLAESTRLGYRTLRATVRADNAGALAFYENVGLVRRDTAGVAAERVVMERRLPPTGGRS